MTEKSNICCWDCSYFNNVDNCTFLDKPTTKDTRCFAELYKLVSVCESEKCELCSRILKGCDGDRENQPKKLQIFPHAGQAKAIASQAQNVAVLAGSQSGKTELFPAIMHKEMLKMGSGSCIVAAPSYPLMDRKLVPIYRYYFEELLNIGHWFEAKKKMIVKSGDFEWIFYFVSADNEEALESMTAKCAHLDEAGQSAFTIDAFEAVKRRVSGNNGRIFFSTALYNFDWLKSEVYDRWLRGDSNYEVIQWDSIIRPGFSKTVWADRKATMQPWKFDMQLRGLYSRPAGMIFSDFDETKHLVTPFEIPKSWNWHVGLDFGPDHTALVWFAEDPKDGVYYLVYSYLTGKKATPDHVADALKRPEAGRVIDWRGGAGNEDQYRLDWSNAGIHVNEPPIRSVEAMLDRVTILFRTDKLKIFITEQNTVSTQNERCILDEIRGFSREVDAQGRTLEKIKDEKLFHKIAASRYFASKISTEGNYSTKAEMCIQEIPKVHLTPGFHAKPFFKTVGVPKFW